MIYLLTLVVYIKIYDRNTVALTIHNMIIICHKICQILNYR